MGLGRKSIGIAAGASTLLASAVLSTGVAAAASNVGAGTIDPSLTVVNLLNINDFHGRIDDNNTGSRGIGFACTVETAKAALGEDKTVFISAGDNIGGTPFTSMSQQDNPTIDYLNALGLFASAVGNHEFDKGWDDLTGRVIPRAGFDYLGANVYQRGTTTPALPEYAVKTVGGIRVAVIGAVTTQTPTMVTPGSVDAIEFGDPVAAVNRVADQLRDGNEGNGEAEVVIAEYHEGASYGTPEGATIEQEIAAGGIFARIVTETSPKVAAIFTGHTHKEYVWDAPLSTGGTRPVVQSNSYAAFLGHVALGYNPATGTVDQYTVRNIPWAAATPECESDPEFVSARSIVQAAVAQAVVVGSVVVGSVSADITTAWTGGKRDDRLRESTLGNLVAQAWLDSLNAPGRTGADLGVMNPGGLRSDLMYAPGAAGEQPGEVTYAEAAAINPFANTLQTKELTGAQVKTLLEQQWQPVGASRPFLRLGLSKNVSWTYDPNRAEGDRVTSIRVNNRPISPTKLYKVASSSFLIAGGDNFTVFQEQRTVVDSGLVDTDAFVTYLKEHPGLAPSFQKRGVAVIPTPQLFRVGRAQTFTVEDFDMNSLGAPHNATVKAFFKFRPAGANPFTTTALDQATALPPRLGQATVTVTATMLHLRDAKKTHPYVYGPTGPSTFRLVFPDTNTVVVMPVTISRR